MDELVNRFRGHMQDSASSVKALSASRQKSITNQSNFTPFPSIPSTQSLKKSKNPILTNTNQKQPHIEEPQLKNNSQLIPQKTSISQNISLPPQPQNLSTNKKQKQKLSSNNLNTASNQHALKSSRRVNQNQMPDKEKQREKQKSKSKKHSKTPQKIVVLTPESLNESFGQSILSVFMNDFKEKNVPSNVLALINKDDLKQKIKILLDQYFAKRLQCNEKERINSDSHLHQVERSNRQMAQSYLVQHGLPSNVIVTNDQPPSSMNHLPETLSRTQLSVKKNLTNEVEKRYFETEKERQYLENKVETLSKRIQVLTKDLEKYSKIQKLINNTIESENQSRKEVTRLRKELEVSALKNTEQQKIWRKQVGQMKDMIMELRNQLLKTHQSHKV